jgi:hypothetical protein
MTNQEKQTRSFMQDKLLTFSEKVSRGQSLPVTNFIRDMLFGICGTGSPSVFNLAKFIQNKVSTKKTSERLYRNLRREGLAEQLQNKLYQIVGHQIKSDTFIIVDESDIIKPYAKKMEDLSMVYDASKKETAPGYNLLNLFACANHEEGYNLLPVSSTIYSNNGDPGKGHIILQDKLVDACLASGSRGIYLFDRGYDDRKLLLFLKENGMSFVIRGKGDRFVVENQKETSFRKAIAKMEYKYEFDSFRKGEKLLCGTRKVTYRTDDHPSKKANTVEVDLVVVKEFNKKGKCYGEFYLLCDFGKRELSEVELIQKAVASYGMRWKIEEAHRHIKQSYHWESMRLATITGLENLNMLLLLAVYFVYSSKEMITRLALAFPKLIFFDKNDWAKLQKFMYYRIAQAFKLCFARATFYNKSPYRYDLTEQLQTKIRLV